MTSAQYWNIKALLSLTGTHISTVLALVKSSKSLCLLGTQHIENFPREYLNHGLDDSFRTNWIWTTCTLAQHVISLLNVQLGTQSTHFVAAPPSYAVWPELTSLLSASWTPSGNVSVDSTIPSRLTLRSKSFNFQSWQTIWTFTWISIEHEFLFVSLIGWPEWEVGEGEEDGDTARWWWRFSF